MDCFHLAIGIVIALTESKLYAMVQIRQPKSFRCTQRGYLSFRECFNLSSTEKSETAEPA